ncbi:hypothetical protein [Nafulsella turpanensis]|uniref:hypothetical protein n=1 Tax=Nafulsella turpanensis TaxID=1265690 RepID=UPI0003645DCF|nr:hypothetical protein [Nafulsella turpanensis]
MLTAILFFSFLGFFLLYNTSKKAELSRSFFLEKWVEARPKTGKAVALLLLTAALAGSIYHWGTGGGFFSFLVILMTIASCTVLIAPLRYINYKGVAVILLVCMVAEIVFKNAGK